MNSQPKVFKSDIQFFKTLLIPIQNKYFLSFSFLYVESSLKKYSSSCCYGRSLEKMLSSQPTSTKVMHIEPFSWEAVNLPLTYDVALPSV